MTPEKRARLDEIEATIQYITDHDNEAWLIDELKSAWAREAELVNWLDEVAIRSRGSLAIHKSSLEK